MCNWFPDNAVVPNCYIGVHSTGRSKVQGCDKIFGGRGIKMMYMNMNISIDNDLRRVTTARVWHSNVWVGTQKLSLPFPPDWRRS